MTLPLLVIAVILGLVEGATEFIPVSSTGHLILAGEWLGFTDDRAKTFEVFIQLGAICAIVWIYRELLWRTVRGLAVEPASRRFAANLIVAFLPAAIAGFLFHDLIKDALFNPRTVAVALVLGGIVMLVIERRPPRPDPVDDSRTMPVRLALGVGLAQMLALVPGVSRSGATIMGGYALGLSRAAATEFSFFLAIPVMFAATLYDLLKSRDVLSAADAPMFATGFVVAFVSALVVVRALLAFVRRSSFVPFAWYRIVLGLALLAFMGLRA